MIAVTWKGGEEKGFGSRLAAENFIRLICKKIAPNLAFSINETHSVD
jgi:hypothetical protein